MLNKRKMKFNVHNQKGFTLIEIIAVLVILGILAAVAIPRYINLQEEARIKSAQAAVAEAKGRLSTAYGVALLKENGANTVTASDVIGNGNFAAGSWGDYNVTVTDHTTYATIAVTHVQNTAVNGVSSNWNVPTP